MKKICIIALMIGLSFSLFACGKYDCTITLPSDKWALKALPNPQFLKEFEVKELKKAQSKEQVAIGLMAEHFTPLIETDERIVKDLKDSLVKEPLYKSAVFNDKGEKELGGNKWRVIEVKTSIQKLELYQDFFLSKKGNKVFALLFTAVNKANYDTYKGDFLKVVETAKFIKK